MLRRLVSAMADAALRDYGLVDDGGTACVTMRQLRSKGFACRHCISNTASALPTVARKWLGPTRPRHANAAPPHRRPLARLSFHQCQNCPLTEQEQPYCPLAAQLTILTPAWKKAHSHDEVGVEVAANVLLDLSAKSLPYAIAESLEEIRCLFRPYFDKPA